MVPDPKLLSDLRRGRRGAVARAISMVENDPREARALLKKIFRHSGTSSVIGVTGPAGAGKSSLIDALVAELEGGGSPAAKKPAVLAVDPTSHLTGGAILGDRVRMAGSTDSGTYIRSIASRGSTGAVSGSLRNIIRVLEYAGFDPVIVESVGAGQTEVGISGIADITVVVFSPQTGDAIQAIKSGITEIGDVYVVHKDDLPGAGALATAVRDFVVSGSGGGGADGAEDHKPLIRTSVKKGRGVRTLARTLEAMMTGKMREQKAALEPARLEAELRDIVLNNMAERIGTMLDSGNKTYLTCLEKLQSRSIDPFEAADRVSRSLSRG